MFYKLAIDIGGTFTDFALVNEETGSVGIHKALTTHDDPSECVLRGAGELLATQGVEFGEIRTAVHGTTLVTNAIIERRGAATGMLTTAGFRDALDIGRERRYDLYDLRLRFPPPLIPRALRVEVNERMGDDGQVIRPLKIEEIDSALTALLAENGIESLAVCLLHAYTNPEHEERIVAHVRERFPKVYVSSSAETSPFMREYERFTTTAANAYVQPMVDRYLGRVEAGLREKGFRGKLYIMTSSGGTFAPDMARRFPVRMLESGPAAGALMSASLGRSSQLSHILSYDMGGTTAKGCLIHEGMPRKEYAMEVAREHEFKQGSGLPISIPVIDMIEIGSGGGSIAEVDDRGLIRVGPRSAGASPGPACYGLGGTRATLTDADLVLGYLDPDFFVGGRMRLDRAAAECAIMDDVGTPLELDLTSAAWGIHEIVNEDCARAFRVHASERGADYRNCSMVAYGGSGPVHALRIARKLRIPRAILPFGAGVFSAFGLLVSPLSFDLLRSRRVALEKLTLDSLLDGFQPLIDEATAPLKQDVRESDIHIVRKLDMRYRGQGFEIEVELPEAIDPEDFAGQITELFAANYEKVFSSSRLDEPIEIVNWKVGARGPLPMGSGLHNSLFARPPFDEESSSPGRKLNSEDLTPNSLKGRRPVYCSEQGDYVDCPVYDRYALAPGVALDGPAVVEERESTCVIGPGDVAKVDGEGHLVVEIRGEGDEG